MTQIEQQKAAKEFAEDWKDKGYEKGESQKFWLDLLCNVFGVQNFANFVYFENQIKEKFTDKTITNFIDIYIPSTKVMIEQKSIDKDLREPIKQSDGTLLNPFQQARKYIAGLPLSQHPRWVVTCNFKSFLVYDMEQPNGEPEEILLENLEKEYYRLSFLTDTGSVHLQKELEISKKAGDIIGEIYDAILKQYKDAEKPSPATLKSLNMLCVRIVFCLYAEDAGIFGHKSMFGDYLKQFEAKDLRRALLDLFAVLDQKEEERDEYLEESLAAFPYVNGGLFTEEDKTIPPITEEIKDLLVKHASSEFDWSEISPTIFGAIFESTLNPETRRSGGMHYTSIENIHKVIDPLFLDDLKAELEEIKQIKTAKTRIEKVKAFHEKIGTLKFLDPACGSGNFLTETFISLRKLGNECIRLEIGDQNQMAFDDDFVKVKIHQFYGIEINDFAVVVAKTALWIAESQMLDETSKIVGRNLNFLPLKSYANIIQGNALRIDWESVVPKNELNYIMGNPPFVGTNYLSESQRDDMDLIWNESDRGKLDFVSCWYVKAAELICGTQIRCAFVSTNSIVQGEQATSLWKKIFSLNMSIDFAHRTFRWDSESNIKAHVHCIIIGFSDKTSSKKKKTIFDESGRGRFVQNINQYLLDAPTIFIEEVSKPLCPVPQIMRGSQATDDGLYLFTEEEKDEFIKNNPNTEKYFKQFMMGREFINNIKRYCLWIPNISPKEIKEHKGIYERVQKVREFRASSKNTQTRQSADTPTRFGQYRPPANRYIAFAKVSSQQRRYVPFGFLTDNVIPGDKLFTIPNATLFHFGILTSNVHMAWMRAVCGRLKSDYSYSTTIVYNNFPWPTPTDEQKAKIEKTAQAILDARAKYPDSSLADLYDETLMPPDLRKAHQENDKAVMQAYGFSTKMTESECVAELFKMYENLTQEI
ncbi:MAG: N-6 DNA methylase [Treponema sp.]|nr:N-6 DNA methylase [Treponema sp.]